MSLTPTHRLEQHRLADHSADGRMLLLAAMALVVGTGGACGAWVLLKMIEFATNLFWFGRLSAEPVEITDAALGIGTELVPVIGSTIVGLMARIVSDERRGHVIPEAIDTNHYGISRLTKTFAIL